MLRSDEELFEGYKAGDESCLTVLFERYLPILTDYITAKVRDANVADDIVQTAFIKVVRYKDHFESGKTFRPWLVSIVNRVCKDHRKVSARRNRRTKSWTDLGQVKDGVQCDPSQALSVSREKTPFQTAADAEQGDKAVRLLSKLPPELRGIVELTVFHENSSRSVGPLFHMSYRHAQNKFKMAIDILRKQMAMPEDNDGVATEGSLVSYLVERMASDEREAVERVLFHESNENCDLNVFSTFIRRLAGEVVPNTLATA